MSSGNHRLARVGRRLEGIAIVFLVLSWAFIALRIWARAWVRSNFSWDDRVMICAGIIFSAYCSSIIYIEENGGGTHVHDLHQLNDLTKWVIVSEVTYVLTVLVIKISLAIFFLRIIIRKWHVKLIYATLAISSISSIATIFYCIFRCGSDLEQYVEKQLKNQCMNQTADRFFAYQHAAIGLLTDCVFVVLPVLLLWNIKIERRAKISVGIILSIATLGCICSAIRFRYVDGLTQVQDFFWAATNVSIWSTIEPGTGIIAGCAATLRPLLKLAFDKVQSIRSAASTGFSSSSANSEHFPSGSKSSNGGMRRGAHIQTITSRRDADEEEDLEANRTVVIEMRDHISKKNESTDCILQSTK